MFSSLGGVVANNDDVMRLGRIRAFVPSDNATLMSDWIEPSGGASSVVPEVGDTVTLFYADGGDNRLVYVSQIAGRTGEQGTDGEAGSDGQDGQDGQDGANGLSELPDLIVTAQKLADDAVTAGKLAAGAVDSRAIADAAIIGRTLANGAVTNAKIGDLAVDVTKLSNGSVSASKLLEGAVTETKLADSAITTAKIAPLAIDLSKIADGAVGTVKIAPLAITTSRIAPAAITTETIAPLAVTTESIAPLAIDTSKISDDAITEDKIVANAITAGKISAGAVTAGSIAANAVTAGTIATNAVTAGKIATGAVTADSLAANSVTAGSIAANSVTSSAISAFAITAGKISGGAVTAGSIAANAVVAGNIDAGAVTADSIAANAITAGKIGADAITSREIASNSITAAQITAGSITALAMAADAVTADALAANSVLARNIVANSITAGKIDSDAITAANIQAGSITSDHIVANAITAGKISAGSIGADAIVANAIIAGKIAADAVTANEIAAGSVSAAKMVVGTITAASGIIGQAAIDGAQIKDAAISSAKIAALAVGSANIADAAIVHAKIGDAAIGTANIIDASIISAHIDDLAVTAAKIQDLSVTSAKINTLSVSSLKIGESAITNTKIATEAIDARTIKAGSITADRLTIGINNNLIKNSSSSDLSTRILRYQTIPADRWSLVGPVSGPALQGGYYFRIEGGTGDTIYGLDDPTPIYSLQNIAVAALVRRETTDTNGLLYLVATMKLSNGAYLRYNAPLVGFPNPIAVTVDPAAPDGSAGYASASEWRRFAGVVGAPPGVVEVQMHIVVSGCTTGAWQVALPEMAVVSDTLQSSDYIEGSSGYRFSSDTSQVEDLNVLNSLGAREINSSSYLYNGRDLVGEVLSGYSDGLSSHGTSSTWSQDSAETTFTSETAIAYLPSGPVTPDRYYSLVYGITLKASSASSTTWRTRIRHTVDGSVPTLSSPVMAASAFDVHVPVSGASARVNHTLVYRPPALYATVRMLLTFQRTSAASATVYIDASNAETQLQMSFIDLGARADVGGVVTQQSFRTTGTVTTPEFRTTASFPATWTRSFDTAGNPVASETNDLYLGVLSATVGQAHSAVGFGDLSGVLAGRTITSIQIRFKVKSAISIGLRTVIAGYHGYTLFANASTFSSQGSGRIYDIAASLHKSGSAYTATLYDASIHGAMTPGGVLASALQSGAARGLTFGPVTALSANLVSTVYPGGTYYGSYTGVLPDRISDPAYAGSLFGFGNQAAPVLLIGSTQ